MNTPSIKFHWPWNNSTKAKQDEIISAINNLQIYNFIQSEETVTYKYYWFASSIWWKIKRKTLSTWIWEITYWVWDYNTAWTDRIDHTYTYY